MYLSRLTTPFGQTCFVFSLCPHLFQSSIFLLQLVLALVFIIPSYSPRRSLVRVCPTFCLCLLNFSICENSRLFPGSYFRSLGRFVKFALNFAHIRFSTFRYSHPNRFSSSSFLHNRALTRGGGGGGVP